MKTRIIALLVSIIMIAVLFSGCSLSLKAPETLMSPPKLSGGYQDLQDVFESQVGSIQTPKKKRLFFILPKKQKKPSTWEFSKKKMMNGSILNLLQVLVHLLTLL